MIGAIIGDTVGSVYEFDNHRTKDIDLINEFSEPTDDTMMTLAVAEICQKRLYDNKDAVIDTFKKWGRAYPHAGYGGRFRQWLFTDSREAYNSYGNGSAMRISPVGWYARNEEEVKYIARKVTEVTHNHEEGLKGAEVVAMCIYYARIGKSKEFIKEYVEKYYNLDFDYEDLKKNYHFNETCQESIPQAIYCFLISEDFEDCLRTTISIGGDCDTTAAISCAIAEAYYKEMDNKLVKKVLSRLPDKVGDCDSREVVLEFYKYQDVASLYDTESVTSKDIIVYIETTTSDKKNIEVLYSRTQYTMIMYLLNYLTVDDEKLYKSHKLSDVFVTDNRDLEYILYKGYLHDFSPGYLNHLCEFISYLKHVNCSRVSKGEIIDYLVENYNVDNLILSREYSQML